ncbi:MAG: hypothetical protein HXX11_06690 [Desulfuromonadales bacterium]|nr:hypothetical protein [Desulfuromonadales bacterium]
MRTTPDCPSPVYPPCRLQRYPLPDERSRACRPRHHYAQSGGQPYNKVVSRGFGEVASGRSRREDVATIHAADNDMLQKAGKIKTGCSWNVVTYYRQGR